MHPTVFALAFWVFAQVSYAIPQVSFSSAVPATTGASPTCGACYGVADVLGIVFGNAVEITVTQVVSTSAGRNGSTFTVTLAETISASSFVVTSEPFTFSTNGVAPAPTGPAVTGNGETVTIGSLTLTSPTSYNIISAYSITSTVSVDGSCSVNEGPAISTAVFQKALAPGGPLIARSAEESFFESIGLICSGAGANPSISTIIPTSTVTVQSTTTATATTPRLPPQPETSPTSSVAAATSTASASASASATASTTVTASTTATTSIAASTVTVTTLSSPSSPVSTRVTPTSISQSSSILATSESSSSSVLSVSPTSPTSPSILPFPSPTSPSISATPSSPSSSSQVAPFPIPVTTTTSALTTTVSVGTTIVVGNTTFPYPTGTGGSGPTITPFPGAASSWNRDISQSWLFWGNGLLATLFSVFVL